MTPTRAYYNAFPVLDPVAACAAVVAIIVGLSLVFVAYDVAQLNKSRSVRNTCSCSTPLRPCH